MIGFVTWPPLSNFLASADIRVFGHTCLFAMLLLIGLTLFYTPGVLVTKPIILVKICYKLLYVIQLVENSFGKVTQGRSRQK